LREKRNLSKLLCVGNEVHIKELVSVAQSAI